MRPQAGCRRNRSTSRQLRRERWPLSRATPWLAKLEGIALADIFAAAGVPDSPYPAEKLLRLLDGLRAMDAGTRKAAVLAMDAADDNWQIGDCIADADRKISALDAYKQQLNQPSCRIASNSRQKS
jgi:hypothetical protein